jgi:hypothetical protein
MRYATEIIALVIIGFLVTSLVTEAILGDDEDLQ